MKNDIVLFIENGNQHEGIIESIDDTTVVIRGCNNTTYILSPSNIMYTL